MSTLTLVRHGQATPFQKEAGVLSASGEAQACALGRYWVANDIRFDEVYTGALVRQTATERGVAACYHDAGLPWPEPQCDPAWNEYDAPGVLSRLVPGDPKLGALADAFERARGGEDEARAFQRMFEAAMLKWTASPAPVDGIEPWPVFRDRVSSAIRRLMAAEPSRRIAVFTSGGPIGLAVQLAIKGPGKSFLEVNWRIRNCSVTQFLFDRERFTLESFNCIGHLHDRSLRTYR